MHLFGFLLQKKYFQKNLKLNKEISYSKSQHKLLTYGGELIFTFN